MLDIAQTIASIFAIFLVVRHNSKSTKIQYYTEIISGLNNLLSYSEKKLERISELIKEEDINKVGEICENILLFL